MAVVAALPGYFAASTHGEVRRGVAAGPAWVAAAGDGVAGFLVAARRFPAAAEVTYAAVLPAWQGRGTGSALVARALADLAGAGVSLVLVKTLDATAGYEPFVATRAFWARRGFVQVDTVDPHPGWSPGNPAALYVAALAPTVPACDGA